QVLSIVLGEALLVGVLSGAISTTLIYGSANLSGGLKFPIAFFPKFMISWHVLWWGPAIGGVTAFLGSVLPAWMAQRTKASEQFSRVGGVESAEFTGRRSISSAIPFMSKRARRRLRAFSWRCLPSSFRFCSP